jgi:hypothetical protein
MKRIKLEKHLGKKVSVTIWDGDIFTGILRKGTGHETNYYQCVGSNKNSGYVGNGDCWFRLSHITTVKPDAENKGACR